MFGITVSHKSFIIAAIASVAVIGAYTGVPAIAQQDPGQRQPGAGGAPGERPRGPGGAMNLEGAMKQMERSYKAIARQIDDPTKDEATLKAISNLQAGAATSKGMMPHEVDEKSGDEKAAAAVEYRKLMLDVLKTAIEMEDSLLAGNRDAAKASLEKIHKMEDSGHEKFRPKKDDDH